MDQEQGSEGLCFYLEGVGLQGPQPATGLHHCSKYKETGES